MQASGLAALSPARRGVPVAPSGRLQGAPGVIVQQELTPNILGAAGEASPGATADTRPKHKPRGPKRGGLRGPKPPSALQAAVGSPGAHHKHHGRWARPSPASARSKSPRGWSTRGEHSYAGGESSSTQRPSVSPSLLGSSGSLCAPVPFGGGNGPGAFLQGPNLCLGEEGMGMLGGGSTCTYSPGGTGALGEGGSLLQRALGTMSGGEAAIEAGQLLRENRGWGRVARAGRAAEAAAWRKPDTGGAGASRPAELVLLSPPVAHLEQKFRGCPGTDATSGCQRVSSAAASRGDAACCRLSPSPPFLAHCWHHPHHSAWKNLSRLRDKPSQQ